MKSILILLFCFSPSVVSAYAVLPSENISFATSIDTLKYGVDFDTRLIELGKVKRGDKVSGSFKLNNTGTEDIVIELVSSCECTTVKHTYTPIKPGKSSPIDFIFDSALKEKSGTSDVDIYLKNKDPKTGEPIFEILHFSYELVD